jgi:cytochrome c-type biogenesis protein CcmE
MTPRQRRLGLVAGILAGVSVAGALAFNAFRDNVTFYFVPAEVTAGKVPPGASFRLGGMVETGTLKRTPGSLDVRFVVTDLDQEHEVPVTYDKVLPDLFREGAGVVAHGHLLSDGTFAADEVLAKHDEKYMPPKMTGALKTRRGEARSQPGASAGTEEPAPASSPGY